MARLRRNGAASFRPVVETLEARNLLSTFTVDHLADDLVGSGLNGSLRYCITQATSGNDSIRFGVSGTINLTAALPDLTHNLSIQGPGANQLTVRRGTGIYAIFTVAAGVTATISGLTISNGNASGIVNSGTLTVSGSTIAGNAANWAGYGGGIYNFGTLTVSGSAVAGNTATWGGGGIYNDHATLIVSNSTISGNSADGGGGLYDNYGTSTVSNSTISGNSANNGGGGTYNGGTLTVSNSTITANSAGDGGGMSCGGPLTVTNSTIAGNSAKGSGGGIANYSLMLTVSNSTITGNIAGNGSGGGIANHMILTLTNSTIAGNSATGSGGGIYLDSGTSMTAGNTIIAKNTAPSGPDLWGDLGSQGFNLVGNSLGGSSFDPTDLLDTDPLLGPLQDNGGPTRTMSLLPDSPALNAGDPGQLGSPDQRGVVRTGGVNIGAYQASASAFIVTAPATAQAGVPFDVTVTAVDPFGQTAIGYTGLVTFTSADPYGAALPADYAFVDADHGAHTFSAAATLYTAGNWDVTATDTATGSITGSASVLVNPAAADHLLFLQQPTDTGAGQTITPAVTVAVVDAFGNVVTGDNSDTVTLAIGTNPSGGSLSGTRTVTVSGGIASFTDLSIDLAGDGYTLHATTPGLTDADSSAFSITA